MDNPTNFSASTKKFTFSFVDNALAGTVQSYVLRATVPYINPGTGQNFFAEWTTKITLFGCSQTSIIDWPVADMTILLGGSTS